MKAKDKASELVEKYYQLDCVLWSEAQYCAHIVVDEVIAIMNDEYLSGSEKIEYWKAVKQEIDNIQTT